MTRSIESITEADLQAYVDDQLDMARRIEVEDYLSRHPDSAMRVMADLRVRDALRLTFRSGPARPATGTMEAARRLQRSLDWIGIKNRLRRVGAVAALVALGWFAHAEFGALGIRETEASLKVPPFVEDAVHAHRTALVRARMQSQPAAPRYDPTEILATTDIALPPLPDDWRVLDAQVFPSKEGHSVELTIDAGRLGTLTLFAARSSKFRVIVPTATGHDAQTIAYWQTGPLVYALTGKVPERPLLRAASEFARAMY
jgi:anti-sigma factor RsiW